MRQRLLVATRNSGKITEFSEMFADQQLQWIGLSELGLDLEVVESGSTFRENAILKATEYAAASGLLTLADDSGLEVDALGGQPGVHTARYGGPGLSPAQRYQLLLENMKDVETMERSARFRCVIALSSRQGIIGTSSGVCEGRIADSPVGNAGFGYDPVFFLPERGQTMAELPACEKHKISHRGQAIAAIAPLLRHVLDDLNAEEN